MLGLLITSVVSGRLITRTGRYKIFPILGSGTATVGLFMLSRCGSTPTFVRFLSAFVLGTGLGGVMCRFW